MTKLEQLQKDKEELTVKLHIYQDKSIIDEEIINTLKEKNKHLKQQMTLLQLEISTNINKIQQFNKSTI
tara:strand:- start:1099 stop:1305 length:207 start_codon:yes stop_codon:yes gene_type:complete